ncbi:MAG: recombinase RecA [Epsilonproteobacteria bacterium]|nr:recombinase RecA [Campylobacterota bacterium]|tara:strand:+ start:2534 stop:3565 length:1032 start_codon:yes stop_codon:yes gene_type:complete
MKEKTATKVQANQESAFKKKALEVTFSQIEKEYGKGSVMLLGEQPEVAAAAIPSGSMQLDDVIGIGGYPKGRIIEVFGPESSGKTTLALQAIAQAQKTGGICAFIDAEHALDPSYAKKLGVNIDDLIISQPDFGEQALDIAEMLIRSGAVDIIVVDSVAALVPKSELEGDMGDSHVGLQARLMSQALRKLASIVHKSNTALFFINQIRQNISTMSFGPKETTTGGKALKFYASLRLDVRRIASLKKNDVHFGNRVLIKAVKNKVAPPFKSVEVDLIFNVGISAELDLLDVALKAGVVSKSGAWLAYDGKNFAQGREQAMQVLQKDEQLFADIKKQTQEVISKI